MPARLSSTTGGSASCTPSRTAGRWNRRKPAVVRALTGDDRPALKSQVTGKGNMNYLYPCDLEIEEEPMPSPLYRKYGRTYIDASIQPRMFEHEDLQLFSLPEQETAPEMTEEDACVVLEK